jgi:hypothetical protein
MKIEEVRTVMKIINIQIKLVQERIPVVHHMFDINF